MHASEPSSDRDAGTAEPLVGKGFLSACSRGTPCCKYFSMSIADSTCMPQPKLVCGFRVYSQLCYHRFLMRLHDPRCPVYASKCRRVCACATVPAREHVGDMTFKLLRRTFNKGLGFKVQQLAEVSCMLAGLHNHESVDVRRGQPRMMM